MVLLIGGALAMLVVIAALGMKRMMDAPMFVPGTVETRIAALGETLDPPLSDENADTWRVTSNVSLHHDSFGDGPDVVFVHGGPGFPTRGRPRGLVALSTSHRVHLFDQRGCGRSTRPITRLGEGSFYAKLRTVENTLGLAEQIADIERIRRRLGRDRLILVGHSLGGLVAALYAAEFPQRVEALILVSPAPLETMPKSGPDLFALIGDRLVGKERDTYASYMKDYFDFKGEVELSGASLSLRFGELRRYWQLATHDLPTSSDGARSGRAELEGRSPTNENDGDAGGFLTLASYASLGRRHDWRPALQRIQARTVVLAGGADLVPVDDVRQFAAAIPGAEVVVVPEAGHFLVDDAPDAIVASVQAATRPPRR